MRTSPTLAALALVSLFTGCGGRSFYDGGQGPFVPLSDQQLQHVLGKFPSPGANARSEIHDAEGNLVPYPAGLSTFADQVVAYEVGIPEPLPEGEDPKTALGPPDYTVNVWEKPHAVSLGNGGSITLRFSQRAFADVDGPDLFIFEIGPSVEAMNVEVSPDGERWTSVGTAPGGPCSIDIGPYVAPGETFSYVRIRDIPHQGAESDAWPGADIDAVGALGVAERVERVALPSEVLFTFDSDTLAEGAARELDRVILAIRGRQGALVTIEGHTDDLGAEEYNQRLSERRAQAVAEYFAKKGIPRERIKARGFGKSRPAAPGESEEARRQNRRVEIVIQGS